MARNLQEGDELIMVVRYRKAQQYNPLGRYADKDGYENFWVAEILVNGNYEYLCSDHLKFECVKEAKRYLKQNSK